MKNIHKLIPLGLLAGAVGLQGQILFNQMNDTMFVVNDGTFNQMTGAFARSTAEGANPIQGVVLSFNSVALDQVPAIQITFNFNGSGLSNNSGQTLAFGFFNGAAVTANAQTAVTSGWEGFFQAPGSRSGTHNGNVAFGVYRQGEGPANLMDHTAWTSGTPSVDGNGGTGSSVSINHTVTAPITITLEQVSATQVRLTSVFTTGRGNTSVSGTVDGVAWTASAVDGVGTITSTYTTDSFDISGFALQARGNFSVTDLEVTVIPEPRVYAALFGLLALGFVAWRRRRR